MSKNNSVFSKLGNLERIILTVAVLVIAAAIAVLTLKPQQAESAYPGLGGDFTLTGVNGPVSLKDYRDEIVVMMFGFTYCPDVCPTGLANVAAALNYLEDDQLKQVQPMFISVDPERDTPKRLDEYVKYFHPQILGISGEKSAIDQVVSQYGAFYQKVPLPDSELKYSVDHSARVYIINKQGGLANLMYHNSSPNELAEAVKALM
ncbi:SCO family protein [Motiliproteus sp. MSK22-1]|uniref:SCO family protein n=1 Tax=Motiliproteus sp. MSK22-1 TaxID=1897630 RepID=UPI0009787C17|nr:SCO family protein [Motiliproteus sp. MSK22-1]OMH25610.1 hypothetical protein BGP75_23980 [Motiliproteus sp. MSK22-1]